MKEIKFENGVKVFTFNHLNKLPWLRHGMTTRLGGVSAPPFNSFNLGKNTRDEVASLKTNYQRLFTCNSATQYKVFLTNQVHGDTIQCVAFNQAELESETIYDKTDGLMTRESGAFLMSFYADCTPLFFADPIQRVVAVSHAGWKGTVRNIGKKTVEQMCSVYGSKPEDILVGIGPSAGICCYEVGEEVIEQLLDSIPTLKDFYSPCDNGKYLVNIKKANVASIIEAGVLIDNIEVSSHCTICDEQFFSYRREGETGRMSGYICITY